MKKIIALAIALASAASIAVAGQNLVVNGHFDDPQDPLASWYTKYDQPGESFYFQNHEYVEVNADGMHAHALRIHVPNVSIAENQGVKVDSYAIPVDPKKNYRLIVEAKSTGPKARITLEGFCLSPKAKDKTAKIPVRTDLRRTEKFPLIYFTNGDAGGMAEIPKVWTKKSMDIPGLASTKAKKMSEHQLASRKKLQYLVVHIVAIGVVGDLYIDNVQLVETP